MKILPRGDDAECEWRVSSATKVSSAKEEARASKVSRVDN